MRIMYKMACNKIIHCYCDHHLGDNLINIFFFSQIKQYIEQNNIEIHYYCHGQYHENVRWFLCSQNIKIFHNTQIGYDFWQGHEDLSSGKFIEDILCDMFNKFLNASQIPIVVDKFEYYEQNLFITDVPPPVDNIDVLVINSSPNSGQFHYDILEFNDFILALNNKYRVAVTNYVNNDVVDLSKYNVRQIASLAKHVKFVIAINTGPSLGLYNRSITEHVEAIYILDDTDHYRFKTDKFVKCKNISDLHFLL